MLSYIISNKLTRGKNQRVPKIYIGSIQKMDGLWNIFELWATYPITNEEPFDLKKNYNSNFRQNTLPINLEHKY